MEEKGKENLEDLPVTANLFTIFGVVLFIALSLSLVEEGRNNAVVVLLLLYFERHFFPLFFLPLFFGGKYIKIVVYRCNINSCVYDFSHLSGGSPDIIIDQLRETLRLKRKQLSTLIATHVDLDFGYEENFSCFLYFVKYNRKNRIARCRSFIFISMRPETELDQV